MSVWVGRRQVEMARRFGNGAAARRWLTRQHCVVPVGLLPPDTRVDDGSPAGELSPDTLVCAEMHWTAARHSLLFD